MEEKELLEKYRYMFEVNYFKKNKELTELSELIDRASKLDDSDLEKAALAIKIKELQTPYNPITIGFECEEGWFPLLDELMDKLSEKDTAKVIQVTQIKEKFGGLRFYYELKDYTLPDINGRFNRHIAEYRDMLYTISREYEKKSFFTCEVCGKPAELCSSGHWLKTVCPEHQGDKFKPCKQAQEIFISK